MSNEKSALEAMLEQYEKNNSSYEKKSEKVYDLKNYFNTYIKEGLKSATKEVRILPTADGSTPFVEMYGHKVNVDGDWKTFPCLKHEKGEACPFCEAREALLSTGVESDKELAKKYNAKKMYVVKVIDREHEEEGVKFWRFNHDYRKEGIYDKIYGVLSSLKTNRDITNPDNGRDLAITINRNQNNVPVVSAVVALDSTPLTEDEALREEWLSDTRTWDDVYSVKSYDYLEIIVKGGIPVWDKEEKCFVDKASLEENDKKEEAEELESELTMGIENVKSNIKTAEKPAAKKVEKPSEDEEEEEDDLPF
jgi:hypothetical protein